MEASSKIRVNPKISVIGVSNIIFRKNLSIDHPNVNLKLSSKRECRGAKMVVLAFNIVLDSCLRRNDVVNRFWDFTDKEFVTSNGSEKSKELESSNNIFSSLRQLADRHNK